MLFAGPPGTGKTMAAEIIAGELELDLYRIDLATIVSKYIGETEKNLDRIFGAAANANAILFFDEADALFGKRTEVKDAHDRYANIEVSYLLQKMEAYDGITVLATNMRQNIDEAFVRRLACIVSISRARRARAPPPVGRRVAGRGAAGARRRLRCAGGGAPLHRREHPQRRIAGVVPGGRQRPAGARRPRGARRGARGAEARQVRARGRASAGSGPVSSPKLDTAPEPVQATLEQVQQGASGPVTLAGRTSRLSAVGRYLGNRRFSSLLTGGVQSEFDIAFAETSSPLQSRATQTIEGQAALGTRAEVQLLWGPYSGEPFWPLGAGETTRSWLPSIARESWFNKQKGEAPSAGNDLLVCKLEPGGGVQVFKVILNEQKAVAEREFLKTTAISSSLVTNVRHNIELLEKREAASGTDPTERGVLRRTIGVLKATDAALSDPTGKTPLPPEIQFELTSLGGAGEQFGIGNESSHLRILGRKFGKQGEKGRLLEDIINRTVVRDRALAERLRAAGVLDPAATDPDVVPMRVLLTPQARAWLALQSGLTPEQWLKQAAEQAKKAAGQEAYDKKKAEELERLQAQAPGKGKTKKLSPEQLEKQAETAAKKAQRDAEKQFKIKAFKKQAFDSTGSVVDNLAPPQPRPAADIGSLERQARAALAAREAAEVKASGAGANRTIEAHQLLLLARNDHIKARLALAEAVAASTGSKADVEAARQLRAAFAEGARVLNEMGEVNRRALETRLVAATPRPGPPSVIVGETAPAPARPVAGESAPVATSRPAPSQPRLTAQRGQPMGPLARGGPSPVGNAVGGVGQLIADAEAMLQHQDAFRDARHAQSLRTLHWWLLKGVRPEAAGVTDRWFRLASILGTGAVWPEPLDDERETDLRQIVIGANEGRFDGIEVEAPNRLEQYESFEGWVRANVRTFEDLYLHFIHDMDPGVRWNTASGDFEVVSWEWGDMPPASISPTWTVDPRINKFMRGIRAEIKLRTQQDTANLSAADVRLGKSGEFRLGAKRRFRAGRFVDRTKVDPVTGLRLWARSWSGFTAEFYEIEHSEVPPGLALVTAANASTYLAIVELRALYHDAETGPVISSGAADRLRLQTVLPATGWKDLRLPVVLVLKESLE